MRYIIESSVQAVTWGFFAFFAVREMMLRAFSEEL